MRNIKRIFGLVTMVTLLFTSCSKDEDEIVLNETEKATLSFGTILNDLVNTKASLKQAVEEIPVCSDEAPAFVEVVLSGPTNVGTMMDPLVVAVHPTPGDFDNDGDEEYFTEESVDLELEPGDYSLDFFAVYDGDPAVSGTNRIWIAPMSGGSLANFVTNTLPMDISLGAGAKKYVDVEVLCFDDRMVNEYGYLFFDIETTEAFEFCFFANYCDENGRHFPAAYSVDIWLGDDNTGAVLYSGSDNVPGVNDAGDFYANPLCFALPNLSQFDDDEDYIYYEVALSDWEDGYGDVEPTVISGTLSRSDIEANFRGDTMEYEHIRFGCGDDGEIPTDSDDDGVPDSIDECPDTEEGVEVDENGCPVDGDADSDGDGVVDSEDECPDTEEGVEVDENGCAVDGDADSDGDGVIDSEDDCPDTEEGVEVDSNGCPVATGCTLEEECNIGELSDPLICYYAFLNGEDDFVLIESEADVIQFFDLEQSVQPAQVSTSFNGGELALEIVSGIDLVSAYQIEVRPVDGGVPSTSCNDYVCSTTVGDTEVVVDDFEGVVTGYPFYLRIQAELCGSF